MLIYNKLVRDKILEIIKNDCKKAKVTILDDLKYYECLVRKLHEEV